MRLRVTGIEQLHHNRSHHEFDQGHEFERHLHRLTMSLKGIHIVADVDAFQVHGLCRTRDGYDCDVAGLSQQPSAARGQQGDDDGEDLDGLRAQRNGVGPEDCSGRVRHCRQLARRDGFSTAMASSRKEVFVPEV